MTIQFIQNALINNHVYQLGEIYNFTAAQEATQIAAGTAVSYPPSAPIVGRNSTGRPPGVLDDATFGYTTASVWQYGGTVYTPAAYCGTDSAAWAPVYESAVGTPVDVMGTTLTKFAGGTCAMIKGYTGAAIDVAITTGGVYQIYTINILATGELDNVSLGAVMATADANTNAKVLKVYDQTGNGNHAALVTATGVPAVVNATVTTSTTLTVNSVTSGTVAVGQTLFGNGIPPGVTIVSGTGPYVIGAAALNPGPEAMYLGVTTPPYVDWDPVIGRYTLQAPNEFTSGGSTNRRCLQLPQTMTITTTQNYGVYAVGTGVGSADVQAPALCAVGDATVSTNYEAILGGVNTPATYGQMSINHVGGANRTVGAYIDCQPMVLLMATASTPLTTISVNEQSATNSGAIAALALAGGYIFSYGSTFFIGYGMMKLCGLAIFNAAPTAAQQKAMRYGAYARFNIYPQVINQVALVGDSRFCNSRVTPGFGVSALLPRYIGRNFKVFNLGVSGTTAQQHTGDGLVPTVTGDAASLAAIKGPGLNYAVILLGVNDFGTNSSTVAQTLGYLQKLCAQITAAGWIPILISELATTTTTGSNPATQLPLLNAAIQAAGAQGMGAALVNLYGYTPVTTPATTAYYSDGLHPTLAVQQIAASAVAATIPSVY